MRRSPFAPLLAASALASLGLIGCGDTSPYADPDAQATEGTGETPDGAVNRALDPGDAGTVGPANLDGEPDGDEAGPTTEGAAATGGAAVGGEPVTARPVSYEQFREIVAAADGPVLVDIWGTWCEHCREAFPHTVALARDHADEGLTVISLAFDTEEKQAEIERFLTESRAGSLTNLRAADGGDGEPWHAILGNGSFPILLVFDAAGEQVAVVNGSDERARAELDAAVGRALGG